MGIADNLSLRERERYSRHLLLPEVGVSGQRRLKGASVLLVGAGGLGSPLALYLAAAGIGRIGIVEFDAVDRTNLHRQVLYGDSDVGRAKLEAATERLRDLNPDIVIEPHAGRIERHNAIELVSGYEVVADGSDAFTTRYLVNDACILAGVPDVNGSVLRFEGQVSIFGHPNGPCYRCLFPEPPPPELVPSCAEGGVLGVLPGIVGTLQALEVIKHILGIGEPLVGRLLLVDALGTRFREIAVARDPACPICGSSPTITALLSDYQAFCSPASHNKMSVPEITVRELKERIDRGETPFILDVRRQDEYDVANLDGTLIPLDQLDDRMNEIEDHRDDDIVVVHCRTGARSAKAVEKLHERGFTNAVNLKGGVHAWSDEIDPSMPKY
jgi:sulfur-carrier protein adenylyltransferase/sulfurtransferase